MKYARALLLRLGIAKKGDAPDVFVLRLARIEQREARRAGQQSLFRNRQTLRAA